MTRSVNVSEFKRRLSHYLRLARQGEAVLIRDRDRVIARLDAAGPESALDGDERLARLEADGVLRRRLRAVDPEAVSRERLDLPADLVRAVLEERSEGR